MNCCSKSDSIHATQDGFQKIIDEASLKKQENNQFDIKDPLKSDDEERSVYEDIDEYNESILEVTKDKLNETRTIGNEDDGDTYEDCSCEEKKEKQSIFEHAANKELKEINNYNNRNKRMPNVSIETKSNDNFSDYGNKNNRRRNSRKNSNRTTNQLQKEKHTEERSNGLLLHEYIEQQKNFLSSSSTTDTNEKDFKPSANGLKNRLDFTTRVPTIVHHAVLASIQTSSSSASDVYLPIENLKITTHFSGNVSQRRISSQTKSRTHSSTNSTSSDHGETLRRKVEQRNDAYQPLDTLIFVNKSKRIPKNTSSYATNQHDREVVTKRNFLHKS